MILSFQHRGLKRFFDTGSVAGSPPHHADKLRELLTALNAANTPADLARPSWRYHMLTGKQKGFASLTVNGNWHLIFRWQGQDLCDTVAAIPTIARIPGLCRPAARARFERGARSPRADRIRCERPVGHAMMPWAIRPFSTRGRRPAGARPWPCRHRAG
ncbi:type II toxin-antitoxin system RelE/ParE family toxin [Bordetella ansorpii]|uniref:type II toxin-antitoxin system RelE/ParE family toxin n=1 Tax=Bordetella ansorpii TaxID=288768 RepID=UPI0009EDA158|nr:type II toxin-antitoxin system RelE/ParE family toxin [Bordetella ansorpii]